jgi:sugar/nucleoside kinase (ribokinase family)
MKKSCLSAGIFVVDHLCNPIDHMPVAGELILADELPLSIGGCAANVAMDLARVGATVNVAGCVGNEFVTDSLASRGVDTSGIRRLNDVGTSGTLIINVKGEDRRFIHCPGANAVMQASDIPLDLVRESKVFYVGGYLLMPALENGGLTKLFREARAAGVTTVLDVVLPGPGDHWKRLADLLAETDVFLPNNDEAAAITGLKDPLDQAKKFRDAGAGTVVITQGERGTLLVSEKISLRASPYPTTFVGGTGAGDAFDAGYIVGLLDDLDPVECVKWGSALGASCVRSISATDSVFDRAEAEEFIAKHPISIETF